MQIYKASKLRLRLVIIFVLLSFGHLSTQAAVWENKFQWTDLWEEAYSKWVVAHWKMDVFTNPQSILYNIPTDCADASYNMRALFAYTYKLPFHAGSYNNSMNQFDVNENENERFRAFILSVNKNVGTKTLMTDTYPIGINRTQFRPGIIFVSDKPINHSVQVVELSPTGIPTLFDSTEPSRVRTLFVRSSFAPYVVKTRSEGYRAFKWPEHYTIADNKIPGYSEQQYEIMEKFRFIDLYFSEFESLLRERPETVDEKAERLMKLVCNEMRYRVQFVEDALENNLKQPANTCYSSTQYDLYSTPSRDRKLASMLRYTLNLLKDGPTWEKLSLQNRGKFNILFLGGNSPADNWCQIQTKSNLDLKMSDIAQASLGQKLVSDPHANEKQRWGLEPYSPQCPQY